MADINIPPFAQARFTHSPLIHGGGIGKASAAPFTTEWKSAGTGANDDAVGDEPWSNPGNITASDDSDAEAILAGNETTEILRATNFGFTTADVPIGATIVGIEVGVERAAFTGDVVADLLATLRTSGGQIGDNKAVGTFLPDSDTEIVYGGAADDWSAGLSDADVRDSSFGFDFRAEVPGGTGTQCTVDHIRIRVHGVG